MVNQIVVFSLDENQYGLPLSNIERIIQVVEITSLPVEHETILGVINVHGKIIPVLNIRKCFGLPNKEMNPNDQLIIANYPNQSLALLVDATRGVFEYPEDEAVDSNDILPGCMPYVKGMIKLQDRMIINLNANDIIPFNGIGSLDEDHTKNNGGK